MNGRVSIRSKHVVLVDVVSENSHVLLEAAMKLPEDERLLLASQIMETLPSEDLTTSLDDLHLLAELNRRFSDPQGAVAWSELEAES